MPRDSLMGRKVRACSVGVGDAERGRTNTNQVDNELKLCMAVGCSTGLFAI